ncbi:MAG: NAD(P)H-hydrate dehydratase [Lentisphaeria bacterium]|nr:NAD(P)H-hydrate dehydratase [Lentisphaeria bacterium]
MKIVAVNEMRRLEAEAMSRAADNRTDGISGADMMELAGSGAALRLLHWIENWPARQRMRIIVLAGKGNNGGDAWVVARFLQRECKIPVTLFSVCKRSELKGDAAYHAELAQYNVEYEEAVEELPPFALSAGSVIVDGLLGTGIKGAPMGAYKRIIEQVNASNLPVMALDVPSGLDADTGDGAEAIHADLTVTMGFPKQGIFLKDGPAVCGRVEVIGIELPLDLVDEAKAVAEAFDLEDARRLVSRRRSDGYKGTYGHLLVLGGCGGYVGAPILSALGGVRGGAGLVTLGVPGGCLANPPLASLIFRRIGAADDGCFKASMLKDLYTLLYNKTAVAYGPGTGDIAEPQILAELLETDLPMVIDADGLRLLAKNPQMLPRRQGETVLTPHLGEMQALMIGFGLDETAPLMTQAVELAKRTGCIVVLKGRFTIVTEPNGRLTLNMSGGPALSTAGSGDVLTGVIGALLAQGMAAANAARLGVFLHGLAGDLWKGAQRAMSADDLAELISDAWKEVSVLS